MPARRSVQGARAHRTGIRRLLCFRRVCSV